MNKSKIQKRIDIVMFNLIENVVHPIIKPLFKFNFSHYRHLIAHFFGWQRGEAKIGYINEEEVIYFECLLCRQRDGITVTKDLI